MKKVEEPVREAIYQRPEAAADIYRWLLEGANRSTNPMLSHPLMGAPDAGIRPVLRLMTKLDWQFLPVVSCQGRLQIELPHTERQPRLVVTLENYHDFTEGDEAMLPPDAFRGHQPVFDRPGLRIYRQALRPCAPPNAIMWAQAREGRLLYTPLDHF